MWQAKFVKRELEKKNKNLKVEIQTMILKKSLINKIKISFKIINEDFHMSNNNNNNNLKRINYWSNIIFHLLMKFNGTILLL